MNIHSWRVCSLLVKCTKKKDLGLLRLHVLGGGLLGVGSHIVEVAGERLAGGREPHPGS